GGGADGWTAGDGTERVEAREIGTLDHGPAAGAAAGSYFETVVRQGAVPDDVPEQPLVGGDPVHRPVQLVQLGFADSASAARRLIDQGGVRLNGERVVAGRYDVPRADLDGAVLAKGKRRQARLRG